MLMVYRLKNLAEMAAEAGLEMAGVAPAAAPPRLRALLQRRLDEGRVTPFEEGDPARRVDAAGLLPGCRSIIVVAMALPCTGEESPAPAAGPRGLVARCARGPDYHLLLASRAKRLLAMIAEKLPAAPAARILVDRSPLVERELARLAGLGWIGENCTLITPSAGSYAALGTILLDRALEESAPLPQGCLACGRCREACPTGALREPYILDPYRCLSYITQAPGIVPAEMRPLMGARLYGCDLCQEVCPHNAALPAEGGTKEQPAPFSFFPAQPLLEPILQMTRKEFDCTVGLTAAGWRGKSILQRNAVIALGNSGDSDAVPALAHVLKRDSRPLLRLHAAWALGRIGGSRARRSLELQLQRETEPAVIAELRQALKQPGP
ncbi:MAG: tRNA epoxyqueuosine(34) reductase QueG [Firmicutes bacterium]|nr:tRNA epoxyqueuosine(34) reductase QueG [Bacillota bacterium]